jgi:glycerol kinase
MTDGQLLILSIDQGTTSSRTLVFNEKGAVISTRQKELDITTPHSGWVEQDANQIWCDVHDLCTDILNRHAADNIIGIGITNQRETTIVWNKNTGKPVYNAIVWQDRRTADYCKTLKPYAAMIQEKTGLMPDPYFSATKLKWILEREDNHDDLLFGTVDCYLLWHLTDRRVHATDASNAARTMLFNIKTQKWDRELCELFGIPMHMLPDVRDNITNFGTCNLFDKPLDILAMAGDQQSATFGQACFNKGMVKSTYGTGCFALMNTGDICVQSDHKLLSTIAWRIDGTVTYAIEGSIFVAGAAIQFLRDQFEFFDDANDTENIAMGVNDTDGVVFVPCLTGLGAPHWDADARGALFGLSRGTTKAHVVRACLDAQAYQTRDLIDAMALDAGHDINIIRVDGGLTHNDYVCQTISNETNCTIQRPLNTEATAWGAAAMAFIQAGIFQSMDDVSAIYTADREFSSQTKITDGYKQWQRAVQSVQLMAE